jgi:hypothetical protein
MQVKRAMPGWDSLETVTRLHGTAQVVGLVLLALMAALVIFVAYQLRHGVWPEWLNFGDYQLRSRVFEIAGAVVLVLLVVAELAAYGYGRRQETLMAGAEQASADRLRRLTADLQTRQKEFEARQQESQVRAKADNANRKENSELRQKLIGAENKLAELEKTFAKTQAQKRLSEDQKRLLTEALRPFAGQKIQIASIRGDDDAQVLAQDFVSAFDAAGWDHDGEAGISTEQWDRDPVGVEVTLNETDARAGKISAGIGALINVVRQLGLVYDNTIYMNGEVPSGEALVKVGKKLRK